MPVQLNHTIIPSRDKLASAQFLTEILGIGPPRPVSHFMVVELSNGVSLDYDEAEWFRPQHFAFLAGDEEFDAIFERVTERGLTYYADPSHRVPGVAAVAADRSSQCPRAARARRQPRL